jgi:hypothetical protein
VDSTPDHDPLPSLACWGAPERAGWARDFIDDLLEAFEACSFDHCAFNLQPQSDGQTEPLRVVFRANSTPMEVVGFDGERAWMLTAMELAAQNSTLRVQVKGDAGPQSSGPLQVVLSRRAPEQTSWIFGIMRVARRAPQPEPKAPPEPMAPRDIHRWIFSRAQARVLARETAPQTTSPSRPARL